MSLQGELRLQVGEFVLDTGPFTVPLQGVTVLFGPSGCGKTTLLRAIAGLEKDVQGRLSFAGQPWLDAGTAVRAVDRRVGFVFQGAALFPHLNVEQNLVYAQRRSGSTAAERDAVAERVGIQPLLRRSVAQLSGGEAQRVAIGRALLTKPQLLCLDEPLSGLDWQARDALLDLVDELAHESALPILYVTHSAAEVERLASQVAFMRQGGIVAVESFQLALSQPRSPLFEQDGPTTVFEGHQERGEREDLRCFVAHSGLRILLPPMAGEQRGGTRSRLRILARDVGVALQPLDGISIQNQIPARIITLEPYRFGRVLLSLETEPGDRLYSEITQLSAERLALAPGQTVYALVKSVALIR